MREFRSKVAVVTGAASGIGRAIAERCAREGMQVVLADIEAPTLAQAADSLTAAGANVLAVPTDVSKPADVAALAERTLAAYGGVQLLFNNAGVNVAGALWETTLADWQWVMGVNLWGVVHGVRVFVPLMLAQEVECHIVNTASIAGLISPPSMAIYNVTKHGVVALSETLFHELTLRGAKVGVSVLCPGWVKTQISASERNRPPALRNDPAGDAPPAAFEKLDRAMRRAVLAGMSARRVADCAFEAIQDGQFYILTHREMKPFVQARMEDILLERAPTVPL